MSEKVLNCQIEQINPVEIDVTIKSLNQVLNTEVSQSLIYAFSPQAYISQLQNGNYLITITDKNGTTTAQISSVTRETLYLWLQDFFNQEGMYVELETGGASDEFI